VKNPVQKELQDGTKRKYQRQLALWDQYVGDLIFLQNIRLISYSHSHERILIVP